jgi:hypothetical protein
LSVELLFERIWRKPGSLLVLARDPHGLPVNSLFESSHPPPGPPPSRVVSRFSTRHIAPSGFATFTPAWYAQLPVPVPSALRVILHHSSTERGMLLVRPHLRRPVVPRTTVTPTQTYWVLGPPLPLRGSRCVASLRLSAQASRPPAGHPRVLPEFRVVFSCASRSPCFRFRVCSLFRLRASLSALPASLSACQTGDLATRPRCC